tara:strand:- start:871 stop:1092 length:222 start_codon:yes stop_codon:yes gene_type:complete
MSYVNFLESKVNYNINVMSKTLDSYIRFKKDDKEFMNYLKETIGNEQKEQNNEEKISKKEINKPTKDNSKTVD